MVVLDLPMSDHYRFTVKAHAHSDFKFEIRQPFCDSVLTVSGNSASKFSLQQNAYSVFNRSDHVHYTDPCAKFNIRDIKRTRKLIPVAKFNIRDL